jgi:hypothetical protein
MQEIKYYQNIPWSRNWIHARHVDRGAYVNGIELIREGGRLSQLTQGERHYKSNREVCKGIVQVRVLWFSTSPLQQVEQRGPAVQVGMLWLPDQSPKSVYCIYFRTKKYKIMSYGLRNG